MTVREKVVSDLNTLNDEQVKQVAVFLRSLKLRTRAKLNKINGNKLQDSIFNLGKNPIETGITDASENLDKYLY